MSSLSWLDKLLPLWILLAMVLGLLLGQFLPSAATALDNGDIAGVSLPIFIGLLWMMYPVLCKVCLLCISVKKQLTLLTSGQI